MFMIAVVLAVTTLFQNVVLRGELKELRALAAVQEAARVDEVQDGERIREELAAVQDRVKGLEKELEQARGRLAVVDELSGQRRAVRAQVYAGQQALGEGWVISGGANTNSGAVVALDGSVVQTLAMRVAKQLESRSAVQGDVTVNNHFGSGGYTDSWYPVGWAGWPYRPGGSGTNRPPAGGAPTSPPVNLPVSNARSGNVGVWRPTQQPFLANPSPWPGTTPMRSSPQVSPRVNPALPAQQPVLLP
jgi:hypothetical protein